MVQISGGQQLRLVVYPIICRVLYIPGGAGVQSSTVGIEVLKLWYSTVNFWKLHIFFVWDPGGETHRATYMACLLMRFAFLQRCWWIYDVCLPMKSLGYWWCCVAPSMSKCFLHLLHLIWGPMRLMIPCVHIIPRSTLCWGQSLKSWLVYDWFIQGPKL